LSVDCGSFAVFPVYPIAFIYWDLRSQAQSRLLHCIGAARGHGSATATLSLKGEPLMTKTCLIAAASLIASTALTTSAATIVYQTGFEAPEYQLGSLIGQNNWSQFDAAAPFANLTVQNSVVRAGSGGGQAVHFQAMGPSADPFTDFTDVWSSDTAISASQIANEPIVRIQWDMMRGLLSAGQAATGSWGIDIYDTNANNLVANVSVYDDLIGPGIAATDDTGTPVYLGDGTLRGTWDSYAVEIDYTTRSYSVFLNGTLIGNPQSIATLADNGIGDVDFVSWTRGTDSAYFDNLIVTTNAVPEPASVSVIGLTGLLLARRRR
jgi:hypothetical protein